MDIENAIEISLKNIAKHGDTDVFPFPFERHVFFDNHESAKSILLEIHKNFDQIIAQDPPSTIETLSQVGYTGFRWATQIEPFWNAYYLALVLMLAEKIEAKRIPKSDNTIYSYRYMWDEENAKLFIDSSWSDYRRRSLELSNEFEYVVVTDIADFYSRIYHHRIENALRRLPEAGEVTKRIMTMLSVFSNNVSYGLPVGGPASRILAELALDSTDLQLLRRGIKFCRYADDYSIFCKDKSDAYKVLVLLSEKLHNEGLSLQKKKTKIITTEEYRETAKLLDPVDAQNQLASEEQKLLNISLRYDPYSETADDDYEALKSAIKDIDIIGILGREISKTTIDTTVSKQAIKAIQALDEHSKFGAITTLLDKDNLLVLSPVFVTVMRTVKSLYDEMQYAGKDFIDTSLQNLYDSSSYLLSIDLNISYFILALSNRSSLRKEEILIEIFDKSTSPMVKRLIILVMANWECHYWLTDIKKNYGGFSVWEKRALILASYTLGDEGKHWRNHIKDNWNSRDNLIKDWYSKRVQTNKSLPV